MPARTVLRMGDPRLSLPAAAVSDFSCPDLPRLVNDLRDTMRAEGGIGIAAPQVGMALQVILFDLGEDAGGERVLINPVLEAMDPAEELAWEGCLCLPGLRGLVPRHRRVRYFGHTLDGAVVCCEAEGFHARVVQHECDHLQGILYPMRMRDMAAFGYREELLAAGVAPQ